MQDPNKITRFDLMRHAQTEWNREKKIQGLCDSPLTAVGERQASAWGRLLAQYSWDRILTSDSDRALTTAERINVFLMGCVLTRLVTPDLAGLASPYWNS